MHHADGGAGGAAHPAESHDLAVATHRSSVWLDEAHEDLEQGRLAGAVLAEQADHLVRAKLQAHVVKCHDAPVVLRDPFDLQCGHRVSGCFEGAHFTTRSRSRCGHVAAETAAITTM